MRTFLAILRFNSLHLHLRIKKPNNRPSAVFPGELNDCSQSIITDYYMISSMNDDSKQTNKQTDRSEARSEHQNDDAENG